MPFSSISLVQYYFLNKLIKGPNLALTSLKVGALLWIVKSLEVSAVVSLSKYYVVTK